MITFSGEGDYLWVIVNVLVRGFVMRQLEALRFQFSLDGFPCLISRKGHDRSVHGVLQM